MGPLCCEKGRAVRKLTTALLAALLSTALAAPAAADPSGPSAREVSQAQQKAQQRAAAVGAAEARLALADAELNRLGAQAERLVEAFNGARVRLQKAQAAAVVADTARQAADAEVSAQRRAMGQFAAATYRSGGNLAMVGALLSSDGPRTFLQRLGTVQQLSRKQSDQLGRLRAAEVTQRLAQQAAAASLADVQRATDTARKAQQAAAAAVLDQQRTIAVLSAQREQLARAAAAAKQRAGQLKAARASFLEAERERKAREAAERRAREIAQQQAAGGGAGIDEPGPPPAGSPADGHSTAAQGRTAVRYAKAQLGKPYQWGASGPDTFDCSGLTMMAWRQAGIDLDHYSASQYNQGTHVARGDLRPGDLVFFADDTNDPSTIHHVGIYVGDGQMINAPQTGDVVKYSSIDRSDYIGATRP
jgi:cell wall-associated NlpC family hydrolase